MWVAPGTVYFRSDRNGEFNLFSYDVQQRTVKQLTEHDDFPILSMGAGAGAIVYEQAGRLHEFDIETAESKPMTIGVMPRLWAAMTISALSIA